VSIPPAGILEGWITTPHGHEHHGHEPSTNTPAVTDGRIHELNPADHASPDMHAGHGSDEHAGHDKHAGHSVAMFRDRFWLSVLLTIPILVWSEMVQEWLGYTAPSFPLSDRIPAILGTVVFIYEGLPFLKGGIQELQDRQPGMMLLISLAIVVAFVASVASEFGWLDLEFWWELALLIDVMLLGTGRR
jgi:Cu2+-exporting ATPase